MNLRLTGRIKKLCCLLVIAHFVTAGQPQNTIITNKGRITFISNAPLEVIKATSDQARIVIDVSSSQLAICVPILSFQGFNSGLQREHFNEKYLESDKYPMATFTGKIIDKVNYSVDGVYDVRVKGVLDVHGQKQTRIIKGRITIKNNTVSLTAEFVIPLMDHRIEVPRLVSEKIATEIEVNISAALAQK